MTTDISPPEKGGNTMKNKKSLTVGIIVAVIVIALIGSIAGSYNNLVKLRENVTSAQSVVETQLQRRADLIPNLVNTVKGYASHEEDVFTAVADARTALSGAKTVDELNNAQSQLDSAVSRLLAIAESYPDLKANENFINLQDELAGTENRISVARQDYNNAAKEYNTKIQSFPASIIAGLFHFEEADYFTATAEAATVPAVDFGK